MTETTDAQFLQQHVELLCSSYHHWTGLYLISPHYDSAAAAEALMSLPFAVVSHDTAADPIFNYANTVALQLFEMDWASFTRLPSRLSAESANQAKRGKALEAVAQQGYTQDYSGIRIASSGHRFWIRKTTIWNLITSDGIYKGQAALIGSTEVA